MFRNKIEIENNTYDLRYGILERDNGCFELFVSKEHDNTIIDKSTISLAPITFDSLVEIVEIMCRNTVTPMSFREIAEDMIFDRLFVEECRKR